MVSLSLVLCARLSARYRTRRVGPRSKLALLGETTARPASSADSGPDTRLLRRESMVAAMASDALLDCVCRYNGGAVTRLMGSGCRSPGTRAWSTDGQHGVTKWPVC